MTLQETELNPWPILLLAAVQTLNGVIVLQTALDVVMLWPQPHLWHGQQTTLVILTEHLEAALHQHLSYR